MTFFREGLEEKEGFGGLTADALGIDHLGVGALRPMRFTKDTHGWSGERRHGGKIKRGEEALHGHLSVALTNRTKRCAVAGVQLLLAALQDGSLV